MLLRVLRDLRFSFSLRSHLERLVAPPAQLGMPPKREKPQDDKTSVPELPPACRFWDVLQFVAPGCPPLTVTSPVNANRPVYMACCYEAMKM